MIEAVDSISNYWHHRSLLHDVIKILYVREGYLPNYPHHLISDSEMCVAFMKFDTWDEFEALTYGKSFFKDHYFIDTGAELTSEIEYRNLVESINYHINQFLSVTDDNRYLPNWVYSYMLGAVIGPKSSVSDIHDFLVSIDNDNIEDKYGYTTEQLCYRLSSMWLNRLPVSELNHRPPTIFGEPHVLKFISFISTDAISELTNKVV